MIAWLETQYPRLFELWRRYERHVAVGALLFGFVFDSLTLDRPDSLIDNAILLTYLTICFLTILLLSVKQSRARRQEVEYQPLFLTLVLQFAFGNLTSGLLVLYARSGTLMGGLIFLSIFAAMLIGNEFVKSRYAQVRFNIAIFYLLLLSYLTLTVPVVMGEIGLRAFLVSGATSLLIIGGFLALVWYAAKNRDILRPAAITVASIFTVFNIFYFLNVIPPVPLAVRDIGVYHSVTLSLPGGYAATYEKNSWWEFWQSTNDTYHRSPGERAYCFSAVFAPARLTTPIYHRWERYSEEEGDWQTISRISFQISGGRDEGYRGYSFVSSPAAGRWRCSVETKSGALVGRFNFTVVFATTPPELSTKTL